MDAIVKTTKNGKKIELIKVKNVWKIQFQFPVNSGLNGLFYRTPEICVKAWNDYAIKNPIIN